MMPHYFPLVSLSIKMTHIHPHIQVQLEIANEPLKFHPSKAFYIFRLELTAVVAYFEDQCCQKRLTKIINFI